MIELLIALFVLSIGLLALAALQVNGMNNTSSAYMRSQATLLAYDIIDRMRSNKASAEAGDYLVEFADSPSSITDCQTTVVDCDPATLANFDINHWKCILGGWNEHETCAKTLQATGVLPHGNGQITVTDDIFTITVRYQERDGTAVDLQVSTLL